MAQLLRKPEPAWAELKPGLSGQAGPEHHYLGNNNLEEGDEQTALAAQQEEDWKVATRKKGPNNARCVVWANSEPFFFLL